MFDWVKKFLTGSRSQPQETALNASAESSDAAGFSDSDSLFVVVIKDCSILLPDSVLPPDSVIPPFSIYGGAPARPVGKVAESHQVFII